MAQQLIAQGFKKVYVLKGGWPAWVGANYPTEDKAETPISYTLRKV